MLLIVLLMCKLIIEPRLVIDLYYYFAMRPYGLLLNYAFTLLSQK